LLVGAAANEGTTLLPPTAEAEAYEERARQQYGAQADAFLALYPTGSDEEAWASQVAALSDRVAWGAARWAQLQTRTGTAPVYVYSFEHAPPGRESERYGAFHSSELVFVFDNLATTDRPWTPDDRTLASEMSSSWVRFATTGDPNGGGLPLWPAYEAGQEAVMA
jgi:para-nitrobenzyl esterase